ncbi:hypothetical protein [Burkholderia ambifaria]
MLDTFDFQARPFCEQRGYVRCGEQPDRIAAQSHILLTKKLGS